MRRGLVLGVAVAALVPFLVLATGVAVSLAAAVDRFCDPAR